MLASNTIPGDPSGRFVATVFGPRADVLRRVTVLGVAIDDLTFEDAIDLLRAALRDDGRRALFFVNAHTLNLACEDPDYRRVLNRADLVFGDGTGVRLAARLAGVRLRANLNGTDLVPALMAAADGDGLRYVLLGARPEVLERTAAATQARYRGWTLAGRHHGYLDAAGADRLVAEINAARPHLLLVGMGNPVQERWIAENRHRLDVPLCVGVGGLFSYLSGDYRRAPAAMRRAGLEWLAVLFTQRQKWKRYVRGNPVFLARILRERVSGIGRPAP